MSIILAIINTRVSTSEQLLNNSLSRQLESVERAASALGAVIPNDGIWSGSVSSKAGTNVTRKDLLEMLNYCKNHKDVKFAIFDEYDRYMRSINEGPYFEVMFQQLGVKVWYASETDAFNGNDAMAKFMRVMSAYKAEGSNEERQRKSISGHIKAISEGRYTFPPKPGYMKGNTAGVHSPNPSEFEPFQRALREIASGLYTTSEALKRLNQSSFTDHRPKLKIDKFRAHILSPYYAGILEVNKQVKARNEAGRHQPMITITEHERIKEICEGSAPKKYERKKENSEFPLANLIMTCDCEIPSKLSGFFKTNGKGWRGAKYRCRGCQKEYNRDFVHGLISDQLSSIDLSEASIKRLLAALTKVWEAKQRGRLLANEDISRRLSKLNKQKADLVMAIADPSNTNIRGDLRAQLEVSNTQIKEAESQLSASNNGEKDWLEFACFSLNFLADLKSNWWSLSREQRAWCEKMLFPAGILLKSEQKVHTPEISPVFRLEATKKNLNFTSDSLLVELRGIAPRSAKLRTTLLQV